MEKFESEIKVVPFSQERVYTKLEDLNNLSALAENVDALKEKMDGKIENIECDHDSLTVTTHGMKLKLAVIEREPMKLIKFEGQGTPVPLNLWIQILPSGQSSSKIKLTIGAEVNMFMKAMVQKPLKEAVGKLSDMLTMIPF